MPPATRRPPRSPAQQPPQPDACAQVLRRFRLIFNAVKAHFREVERKTGVAGAQVWALSVVQASPGIGVSGLAQAMDIHQSTASNLVRSLLEKEYLTSSRAAADRRSVELKLTAAGQRILRKAPGPFAGVLPEALRALDTRTLRRLDRDLASLIQLLGVDERAGGIPLGQP